MSTSPGPWTRYQVSHDAQNWVWLDDVSGALIDFRYFRLSDGSDSPGATIDQYPPASAPTLKEERDQAVALLLEYGELELRPWCGGHGLACETEPPCWEHRRRAFLEKVK